MEEVIEIISYSLSIIALILVVSLTVVHFYIKIRKCFPTYVNCWFCNTWTWVPYDNWNSFECPNCSQYNGFNVDGGYNKVIEAQHRYTRMSPSNSRGNSNGLCNNCNRNQQLKIVQLAKFTPLVEENYDEEIEHFRKQLEKAYDLCPSCERFLRTTLLKEKTTFLVNHVMNIRQKGANIYEKFKRKSIAFRSGLAIVKLLKCLQNILAVFVILSVTSEILKKSHPKWFSMNIEPYYESGLRISKSLSLLEFSTDDIGYNKFFVGISIGVLIQLPLYFLEENLMCIKVNQLLCWSFLALTSWNKTEELLMNSFQIICGFVIFYSSFIGFRRSLPKKIMIKKLSPHQEYDDKYGDYFDDEDSKSYRPDKKLIYNKNEYLTPINLQGNRISNVRCGMNSTEQGKSFYSYNSKKSVFYVSSGRFSMRNNSYRESFIPGGFWKNDNIHAMAVHLNRRNPFSGNFFSQMNENYSPTFNDSQCHSLPSSLETSLSGDFERLSVSPNSRYISPSTTPSASAVSNCN